MNQPLEVAIDAARRAGRLLADGYRKPKSVDYKGDIDLVTEYDRAAEKEIVEAIRSAFPDHRIQAEEGGASGDDPDHRWHIDPLDGTTNFAHGFPHFCVSVAYERGSGPARSMEIGVVFDPVRDELFTAVRGQGARLNKAPISVSDQNDLNQALLATGFPYWVREHPEPALAWFKTFQITCQGVRRAGAAALDLAYLAAGRVDGFWELGLKPWDTAAGMLLVQEAGGRVTDFRDRPFHPFLKEILATNGHLHYNMLKVLETGVSDLSERQSAVRGTLDEENPDQ